MTKILRSYYELEKIKTFEDRFNYLRIGNQYVGDSSFGFDRYLNQIIYHSRRWKSARDTVILRDSGNDLGLDGFPIYHLIVVHHMNPLTMEEIQQGSDKIFDPVFLITTSSRTHQDIHYGNRSSVAKVLVDRVDGDTKLWS